MDLSTFQLQPLLLCGGSGTRLWPLSRETYPKQFVDLGFGHSLFQASALRAARFSKKEPLVVCGEAHRFTVAAQLQGITTGQILVEPVARNTAAAVAAACLQVVEEDPIIVMMPCDHHLPDETLFHAALYQAANLAQAGYLVQMGIKPEYPATEYGYIECGEPLMGGFHIAAMKEKPDATQANAFIEAGYLWNSGLLIFKASVMLSELRKLCQEILTPVESAVAGANQVDNQIFLAKEPYQSIPAISLDYAILEKTKHSACVPYAGFWSDLGTWDSIAKLHARTHGNETSGDVLLNECHNTFVLSTDRLICAYGLDNTVIVETPDAILIADRENPKAVKHFVEKLNEAGRKEARDPHRVHRPWGWYESLSNGESHQTKRIRVNQGSAISLQYHHHRNEHWIIVSGIATITRNDEIIRLKAGESVFIPALAVHRIAAEEGPVEFIEVQTGSYFGEDDIVRLEDRYGR